MATVSMTQAAALVGKSKGTLSKALKSGRLSYAEKTDNGYLIDLSELYRVFPAKPSQEVEQARLETPSETGKLQVEALQRELALMREAGEAKDAVIADLRTDRDEWREQAKQAQRLLEGPKDDVSNRERRGWRAWFTRNG